MKVLGLLQGKIPLTRIPFSKISLISIYANRLRVTEIFQLQSMICNHKQEITRFIKQEQHKNYR